MSSDDSLLALCHYCIWLAFYSGLFTRPYWRSDNHIASNVYVGMVFGELLIPLPFSSRANLLPTKPGRHAADIANAQQPTLVASIYWIRE